MEKASRIYVAGHMGLAGSSIVRRLRREGYMNLLTRTHAELDLTCQSSVFRFFEEERPEYVFLAAARVGGIWANSAFPAEFIFENLMIEANVIEAARRCGAKKLLFLGSSCIYPRLAPQPIREEYLLTGPLEATNEWYAIAKIAGIKMAQAYRRQYGLATICLMPSNLYGPGDNFDLQTSHVLPALIRKFHEGKLAKAPQVEIWGTGNPRREFLFVDDLADAALFLMLHYDGEEIINVGTGEDWSIRQLCDIVRSVVGYEGEIAFDASRPDGTPRKLLDVSKLSGMGWRARTPLLDGIRKTYEWYCRSVKQAAPTGHCQPRAGASGTKMQDRSAIDRGPQPWREC